MKTAKDLELSLLIKENTIQNLKLTNMHLQIKNNELETKIIKAISYIKIHTNNGMFELRTDDIDELLNLLRSESEDEI